MGRPNDRMCERCGEWKGDCTCEPGTRCGHCGHAADPEQDSDGACNYCGHALGEDDD
jgi:hypothetical protein